MNKANLKYKILLVFLFLNVSFGSAVAETKWVIGAGLGHIRANSYIGSSEKTSITTPFPYFKVETKWFDVTKEALQLKLFEETPFRIGLNYDLGLPVKSNEISLRVGMSDLDPVLQIGPMVSYQLDIDSEVIWKWELPVLYAFSISDGDLKSIGWNVMPRISASSVRKEGSSESVLTWSFGPVYASEAYNQYYYSVNAFDVTTTRNEYDAIDGSAGYRMNLSFRKELNGYWFGFHLRYQDLSNAVFVGSPLVDEKNYWSAAIGMGWQFSGNK